jgi:hypothetical protein
MKSVNPREADRKWAGAAFAIDGAASPPPRAHSKEWIDRDSPCQPTGRHPTGYRSL